MDLAGTVLAFALVADEPFARIYGSTDPVAQQHYLDHWNLVGTLLGVHPDYLTADIRSARAMVVAISADWYEPGANSAGIELAKALCEYIESWMPKLIHGVVPAMMRYLAPNGLADLLEVEDTHPHIPPAAVAALLASLEFSGDLANELFPLGLEAAILRSEPVSALRLVASVIGEAVGDVVDRLTHHGQQPPRHPLEDLHIDVVIKGLAARLLQR